MRKRTSNIWKCPSAEFKSLIEKSESYAEVLRFFKKENKGGNFKTLKARIKEEGVDTHHIDSTRKYRFFDNHKKAAPLETVMVKNSNYSRGSLKSRLLKEGLLENKCYVCNLKNSWNDLPLVMVLDHINGDGHDNRLCNLRFLCPNCNSQQPTFAGRKNKILKYCKCGLTIYKTSTQCVNCSNGDQRKAKRPSHEKLLCEIEQWGYCGTGRKYGVSDNAIRNWLKYPKRSISRSGSDS